MTGGSVSAVDSIGLGVYDPMMSMMGGYYPNMGMMGLSGAYSPYMMGGMNPTFMGQMIDYQTEMMKKMYTAKEDLEKQRLEHSTQMHALNQKADVINMEAHERATFLKAMQEADIQDAVRGLYDAVRRGDQDDICMKYDTVKMVLQRKYGDYYASSDGQKNSAQKLNYHISLLYSQLGTAWNGGAVADLKTDICAFGESAFTNGFRRTLFGNSGHNEFYSEQTLNYLFGNRINDQGSKARAQKAGEWCAHGAEALAIAPAAGFAAGLGLTAIAKAILPNGWSGWAKFGRLGKIGALAAIAGDIFWQCSRT